MNLLLFLTLLGCQTNEMSVANPGKPSYSGIYPHLAYYNNEAECGTGAVVPWGNRLWVITYGPHLPYGSSDKLYEISPNLDMTIREESIGGTPANRMIHEESEQLFIGPYAIDLAGKVRSIPYDRMPGRHTGNARHLTDPQNKIYYGTMEEGFYAVDVHTLAIDTLYLDGNVTRKPGEMGQEAHVLPGAHGKGLYSGQGVLVYSNNGEATREALHQFDVEAGVLAEWDGTTWETVRRNQFVEVTGPGGIYGNKNPETDPIWATGWDHKSVLLGVRNPTTGWEFYRLPKASHSYDGAHGWNTEWPRIRDIGTSDNPDYLMTMHGMFWKFPQDFNVGNSGGIRPRSSYLKVIGDYTRWNNRLVFGTDDSAHKEFLNTRSIKGELEGAGQSNSNLWFTSIGLPDQLGPNTAGGSVWLSENVDAGTPSEPFLFAGWKHRAAWVNNEGNSVTTFHFEIDKDGSGKWKALRSITLKPNSSAEIIFDNSDAGEWVRVVSSVQTKATVHFTYTDRSRFSSHDDDMFRGLASVDNSRSATGGLLYGLGGDRKSLGLLATAMNETGVKEVGYYELDGEMNLTKNDDEEMATFIRQRFAIPKDVVTVEEASVLVVDDRGRRWRFPRGHDEFDQRVNNAVIRICREVVTERDLLNLHGTFYELPAENADGFAKVRPIASHNLWVHDYASFRGMLIMTGVDKGTHNNEHIISSADGNAHVWAGAIDDLWKLGKPIGKGGPWYETSVEKGAVSDPYLIGFYDQRNLEISHDHAESVTFTISVEPIGHGPWMEYMVIDVPAGEVFKYRFPDEFQARWIRFETDTECKATTLLTYN